MRKHTINPREFPGKVRALIRVMMNLESITTMVRACAGCGVLHSAGYRCASERKLDRSMARYGRFASSTVILAKGTK